MWTCGHALLSIIALAPSSLTVLRCLQLKQVLRRCPEFLLYLGITVNAHAVRSLGPVSFCSACLVSSSAKYLYPHHHHQHHHHQQHHHHHQHYKMCYSTTSPTLFGVSCRNILFSKKPRGILGATTMRDRFFLSGCGA